MSEHFFSPETWESFNEKILRVGVLAGSLLDFSTGLLDRSGLPLKEVLVEFAEFAPAMLGGVSRDGEYGQAGLAGVFRSLFGASVDTRKYCSLKAVPGEDAEAGVTLQVGQESLSGPLRAVRALAEQGLEAWQPGLSSKMAQGQGEMYFRQPMKAVQDTQALLQGLADLSAGVDERATFLYMTRRITWRYLVATFPKVQEPEALTFFQQRLGLERLWEPDPNPEDGYTLWGYPDYGPSSRDDFRKGVSTTTYGGGVLSLNRLAWLLFSGQTYDEWWGIPTAVLAQPPNLPQLFQQRAKGQLTRVRRPDNPFSDLRLEYLSRGVKVEGPVAMPSEIQREYRVDRNRAVSVHKLLDWLIPSICYGEREFEIQCAPSGEVFIETDWRGSW